MKIHLAIRLTTICATVTALTSALTMAADARWAARETQQVPVERILKNLENSPKKNGSPDEKATLEFQIGRAHSLAYARKSDTMAAQKSDTANGDPVPFYGLGTRDFTQFQPVPAKNGEQTEAAKKHLKQAIDHLKKAIALEPTLLAAKLGLAWCMIEDGQKQAAVPLLREVFKTAYEQEKDKNGMFGSSMAVEAAHYLLPLLDKNKDAGEFADLKSKSDRLDLSFRAVTPIVVPLTPDVGIQQMMQNGRVEFDLDGTGKRVYSEWPTAMSGWLVYDGTNQRAITSGLQLFGQCTFWIFWKDGYEALSSLDNNHDGKLTGAELVGLSVWSDINVDGISQPEEIIPLSDLGIESFSCLSTPMKEGRKSIGGVGFKGGKRGDSYDWIVREASRN